MRSNPALANELHRRARQAQAAGRYAETEELYAAVVRADPGSVLAHLDRGRFYKLIGRLDDAESSLRSALGVAPKDARVRHALGFVLLSQGRHREGWSLYEARHEVPELGLAKPKLPFAEWRGEDLAGKSLLIAPEQGFGDQIQFARFAPWLAAKGADVTLICHPSLAPLFQQSFDVRVIAADGPVEFPDPDYWVVSGSLAGRSGLELEEMPNGPYLRSSRAPARATGRIGVAVKGSPAHSNDANRSLSGPLAAELLGLPGALSLHPEDTGAKTFADTANLIDQLDLVISVDTSVAHLSAAMGKPTWILVPRLMTDWRWMEDRRDSPWYPTARLFRQPAAGDWTSVVSDIRQALADRPAGG